MKSLLLAFYLLSSLSSYHKPNSNSTAFEFSKSIYKVKGTISKADGDYVIIPEGSKNQQFIPAYLPEEYKKNGLEVTFDGDLGKVDNNNTALNIHKIWVAYELKEKYKLVHKSYELN